MEINKSDVVISTSGRDKGDVFIVLSKDENFLYLINGRNRRIEAPKRKKIKHTSFFKHGESRISEKIMNESKITNSEIRRAISEIKKCPSQAHAEEVD